MRCWLLVLVLTAGCAGPQVATLLPVTGPAGPVLALAPLRVSFEATQDRARTDRVPARSTAECVSCGEVQPRGPEPRTVCEECGQSSFRAVFSRPYVPRAPAGLDASWAAALRERGSFQRIVSLSGSEETWAEAAQKAGASRLLAVELEDLELRLLEKNAWHIPKVIVFILSAILIFPGVDPLNWFIPGEDYGVVAYGRWSLRDADGNLLQQGRFEEELARDAFAAFGIGSVPSRPWFVAGLLRTPGCLDESDWGVLWKALREPAETGLVHALVRLAEDRRETAK